MDYAVVTVKKGEARSLKAGGLWIYDNEIASVMGAVEDGGLVIVHDFDGFYLGTGFINRHSKITVRNLTREKNTPRENAVIYGFEESEALFRVCRFLLSKGYALPSRAFYEPQTKQKSRYYLEIREAPTTSGCKKTKYLRENLFIGEFGTRMEGEISLSYLREHCVPLCEENAVNILAPLAN